MSASRTRPASLPAAALRATAVVAVLFLGVSLGCADGEPAPNRAAFDSDEEEAAIRALLDAQLQAWNAGDIEGFMSGYLEGERLRFVSGAEVRRGWERTLERYRTNYPDRSAMGRLTFEDLEVEVLGPSVAMVAGAWRLEREADTPHGRYTLLLEKGPTGWRIVYDHTSAAPTQ